MLLGVIFKGQGTDATVFSLLLAIESLLFAGVGVAVMLNTPQNAVGRTSLTPSTLGIALAWFISFVGLAGVLMWTSVFADPWPCDMRGAIVALVVLAATVGEAVFAWIFAFALKTKSKLPAA